MDIFLALAAGFAVGFLVPTRVMVLCLVPVAVIAVNVVSAMVLDHPIDATGVLLGMVFAFPTALSINRFMHN